MLINLSGKLKGFYATAKKGKIPLAQFTLEKNFLKNSIKNFLKELLYFIGLFIHKMDVLSSYQEINKDFFKILEEFINKFYYFLLENEPHLKAEFFDTSDDHIATIDNILKQTKEYNKYFFDIYGITALKINADKQTIMFAFDANLASCFESCIKILVLILYINENTCEEKELMDILFELRFETYDVLKLHLEYQNENNIGLIRNVENFLANWQEPPRAS